MFGLARTTGTPRAYRALAPPNCSVRLSPASYRLHPPSSGRIPQVPPTSLDVRSRTPNRHSCVPGSSPPQLFISSLPRFLQAPLTVFRSNPVGSTDIEPRGSMFGFACQSGPPLCILGSTSPALRPAPLAQPTKPYRSLFSSFTDTTGIESVGLDSRFRALKRPSASPCDFHHYIYTFLSPIAPTYKYDVLQADLSPSLLILYYNIIYSLFKKNNA
jgi:hypothetical protein